MYAWIVGRLVRRAFGALSRGDWAKVVSQFADDAHFRFPGQHALAGEYHAKADIEDWFRRSWELLDIELTPEDVLVRGWPWNTRVCTKFAVRVTAPDGAVHTNEGMQYLRMSWGRIKTDFLYEDTQKVADYVPRAARQPAGVAPTA